MSESTGVEPAERKKEREREREKVLLLERVLCQRAWGSNLWRQRERKKERKKERERKCFYWRECYAESMGVEPVASEREKERKKERKRERESAMPESTGV